MSSRRIELKSCWMAFKRILHPSLWNWQLLTRWTSSLISFLSQNVHIICFSGSFGLWWRPTSIHNLWKLTWNLAREHLYSSFLLPVIDKIPWNNSSSHSICSKNSVTIYVMYLLTQYALVQGPFSISYLEAQVTWTFFPHNPLTVFYLLSKWLGSQVTWRNPKWLRLLTWGYMYLGSL